MNAQVRLGKAVTTIQDADRLHVVDGLVEIQRSTPTGPQTVAVAGDDLLVILEPAGEAPETPPVPEAPPQEALWHPVGAPMD